MGNGICRQSIQSHISCCASAPFIEVNDLNALMAKTRNIADALRRSWSRPCTNMVERRLIGNVDLHDRVGRYSPWASLQKRHFSAIFDLNAVVAGDVRTI
jgi:hypothetical protein